MFKIMGGDGREYGPVSGTVIRQWVAEGRANGQTRVAAEGTTEWKNLADFPEFADLFAPKPAPAATAESSVPPAASASALPGVSAVGSTSPPSRFMIVGGDGRTYGPVTADEVRQWIADRRANAQTRAQRDGATEWKTLAEYPEFAAQFGGWSGGAAAPQLRPGGQPASQPQAALASALVNGPAIFLIVVNAMTIVGALLGLSQAGVKPDMLDGIAGMDPAAKKFLMQMLAMQVPGNIVALLTSSFCLFGAISMMNLRRHTVCIVAAVLTLLPCTGCCCGLGLAAGIWALVVLAKPEVRDAFH